MVRSSENIPGAHPYWYAQVLGVYHTFVSTTHPEARNQNTQRMEFLWVRWLGIEPRYRFGPRYARLPMVGFVEYTDELAFGFLDPSLVIRGCHLIPRFHSGRTDALMPYNSPTAARMPGIVDDWTNYYVNMFVFPRNFCLVLSEPYIAALLIATCSRDTMVVGLDTWTLLMWRRQRTSSRRKL